MADTPQSPRGKKAEPAAEEPAEVVTEETEREESDEVDALEETEPDEIAQEVDELEEIAQEVDELEEIDENGVSEAEAEASIAAIVEAEREAEAEEAAVAEAEEAMEREEPEEEAAAPSRRLAVLGSPIGHSQSPALHRAAYKALGLDWSYEPVEVVEDSLPGFLEGLGPEWRGLSLTMPLKKAVLPLLTESDRIAEQTGGANTVLLDGEEVRGFNTDVTGIVRAVQAAGIESVRYVHLLGGGATAASALVAAAELGAERVDIHVRDLARSVWLEPLAHDLGLRVRILPFAQADRSLDVPELVISTLPGGTTTDALYTDSTRRRSLLFDVAYEPWPTELARQWLAVGGRVVSGLAMLAHQALLQVRIFVAGDPLEPLPDEAGVLEAMLDAVGIAADGSPLEA